MKKTGIYILLTILFSLVCSSNAFCFLAIIPHTKKKLEENKSVLIGLLRKRESLERIRDEERRVEKKEK